jgi:hypothetical protein
VVVVSYCLNYANVHESKNVLQARLIHVSSAVTVPTGRSICWSLPNHQSLSKPSAEVASQALSFASVRSTVFSAAL